MYNIRTQATKSTTSKYDNNIIILNKLVNIKYLTLPLLFQ